MHGGAGAADQHHLSGVPAQDAHRQVGRTGRLLPVHRDSGDGCGRAGHFAWLLLRRGGLARGGDQELLRRVHLQPEQRPRKAQVGLQLERGVAQFEIVPVAQQEAAVLEHPQVAGPVVNRPQGLGLDRSGRKRQHHGANLALVAGIALPGLAADQPRHTKGEQQPVFIEKVQRNQAAALAQVDGPRSRESQRLDGNRERGGLRGLVGESVGQRALPGDAGRFRRIRCIRHIGQLRHPALDQGAGDCAQRRTGHRRQTQARAQPRPCPQQPHCHRYSFSPMGPVLGSDTSIRRLCASTRALANTTTMGQRLMFLGYGACLVAGCLWGTGFYFGRLALNEMSVEHMLLYRFLFASLGMLPVAVVHRSRFRLTGGEARLLLVSAALAVAGQVLLQFHGLARTTVSHASLMVGAMPVLLAAAAALFAGERLDRLGWLALSGSTVGAALIVLGGSRGPAVHGEPTLTGDLMVVASLVTSLAWILLRKKLMQTHSPPVVTAYTILSGTAMLAVWVLGPWLIRSEER